MFPLASRLLTHGRSRDFFSSPLDHYLILGQQVVFQSLELQEVRISPQRLSSRSYQQVNASKNLGSHPSKAEPATSSTPIQMLFVFPGLTYMTTDQKRVVWIAQNGKALVFVREVLGSNPEANRCWLRVDQRRPESAICMHQWAVTHSGVW